MLEQAYLHRDAYRDARRYLADRLNPAEVPYILTRIGLMHRRYWRKKEKFSIQTEILDEWVQDLSEYPAWLIEKACRNWRKSPDPGTKWAPSDSGELMASVLKEYRDLQKTMDACNAAIDSLKWFQPQKKLSESQIKLRRLQVADAIERSTGMPAPPPRRPPKSKQELERHREHQMQVLKRWSEEESADNEEHF